MAKELIKFNGRGYEVRNIKDEMWKDVPQNRSVKCYAAAYSVADCCRLIEEYTGRKFPRREIDVYWSIGIWGKPMDGVEVERGIWLQFDYNEKPVRVL
jgi:hypothetical protein